MLKAPFIILTASIFLCASTAWAQSYTIIDLGSFGGLNGSTAMAVNDSGKATGWASRGSDVFAPFLWSQTKGLQPLGTLGGSQGFGLSINASSQIVGWSTIKFVQRTFLWKPKTGMQNLSTLDGSFNMASTINTTSQIAK